MADKDSGSFTGNSIAKGKSSGIVDSSLPNGQKLKSAYPMDNVHGLSLPNTRGGSFAGSDSNLSHSLKGASAVQDGPGAAGSVKHVRIKGGH